MTERSSEKTAKPGRNPAWAIPMVGLFAPFILWAMR